MSEKPDRALEQYRDERMLKLEKLVKEVADHQTASDAELKKVSGTLEQYTTILEGVKARLEKIGEDLSTAFSKQSEAVKVYIDGRLGNAQTPQGATGGLGDRIFGENGVVSKMLDRWTTTGRLPFLGGEAPNPADSPWFIDLNAEWNKRVGYAFRKFAEKQISLLPAVPEEAVRVTHAP